MHENTVLILRMGPFHFGRFRPVAVSRSFRLPHPTFHVLRLRVYLAAKLKLALLFIVTKTPLLQYVKSKSSQLDVYKKYLIKHLQSIISMQGY